MSAELLMGSYTGLWVASEQQHSGNGQTDTLTQGPLSTLSRCALARADVTGVQLAWISGCCNAAAMLLGPKGMSGGSE